MCYYWKTTEAANKEQELGLDEIDRIAEKLGNFFILFLTGGEPTLRDDLPEICRIFRDKNRISKIFFPTNGLNPPRLAQVVQRIIQLCPDTQMDILLPLEGEREVNDYIRGKNGAFDTTVESIKKCLELKKKHPKIVVNVNTTLSNQNIKSFSKLKEFVFNNLDVDMHCFSPVRGVLRDSNILPPDFKEWTELCLGMERYLFLYQNKRGSKVRNFLRLNFLRNFYKMVGEILKTEKQPFKCLAGQRIAVLEWDGGVRLCELTPVVGNVRSMNYDLSAALKTPEALHQFSTIGACSTCTHSCFLVSSLPYYPARFFRHYLP
jgi:MoaA/NifB/PqqE/SkfB family radical SAM enzyme